MFKGFLSYLTLCFYLLLTQAQAQNPYISNLYGVVSQNSAHLYWTVAKGPYTSNDTELQWSLDSLAGYQTIYTNSYPCGNPNSDESYDHIHPTTAGLLTNPDLNKKNYYRIYMPPASYSQVAVVDFAAVNGGYKVYPSPVEAQSRVEFSNPDGKEFIVDITDPRGFLLYHFENISSNYFYVNADWFDKLNLYFFRVYPVDGSAKPIRGKFLIIKS